MFRRTSELMPRHTIGRASFVGVIGVLAIVGWLLNRPHPEAIDRLTAEAASRGWIVEAADRKSGLFSSVLRNARLRYQQFPGLTAEIATIEVRHWPWLRPRVTVSQVQAQLAGEPAVVLHAIGSLSGLGDSPTVGEVNAVYHHRVLGSVELLGIKGRSRGLGLVLDIERVQLGKHTWRKVTFAIEPHGDMVVITPGDDVGSAGVQLSCFPSSGGKSRWLLDVPHQAARPLASRVGWELGPDTDPTQLAGSLSLDIPEDATEAVRGRIQLVLDRWPTGAPAEAEPMMGRTLSLLSNVVSAANGSGWDLPRVELTTLAFELAGKGHIDLGEHPRLTLDAEGDRTCQQLRSRLPPSGKRELVERHLAGRDGKTAKTVDSGEIRIGFHWSSTADTTNLPIWHLGRGCGLAAWTTEPVPSR